jgi:hypothetical protein
MSKPSKRQKGAVRHAEGQHGDKTHAAFLEQLNASQQRDEAVESSEKNRLRRETGDDGSTPEG